MTILLFPSLYLCIYLMKSLDEGFLRVKGYLCRQKNLALDRCPKEIINTLSLKKKREGGEGKTGI